MTSQISQSSPRTKLFRGGQVRRLREEKGWRQGALARAAGVSPSYLNQIEHDQRPLTAPVRARLEAALGIDTQALSDDADARLAVELREALADAAEPVPAADVRSLAATMPAMARSLVALHRRTRELADGNAAMAAQLGEQWAAAQAPRRPFEEVREFFYARANHVEPLDHAAERLYRTAAFRPGGVRAGLAEHLARAHGVTVRFDADQAEQRRYDPEHRLLHISAHRRPGQQAFQMATQLAFLELGDELDALIDAAQFASEEARRLARVGLANYFAGALLLPYGDFLRAAEEEQYDIERLGRRFGVGFETVCHRLSTLQREGARGVPFFFVRVDRAGNISKRQSATDFHFSRVGGTCPLWNVYEAFAQPGRVLTQLARMPDGRTYLWIARTVRQTVGAWGEPGKTFAIGLGCDLRHAERLIYARGLDLADPGATTPIGPGCRMCERRHCPQRAFPLIGKPVAVDENRCAITPYPVA